MADTKAVIKEFKNKKVKDLVDKGELDGNPILPKYPSAQLWNTVMFESERQEFMQAIEDVDYSWSDYEAEMKAHWPPEKQKKTTWRAA